ncbi:hypothetical protein [Motilimonas sp. KMU-193]|uniref:hypothetical protein n=1 Tax=Motilimonas sp. KMU-193 TaxID=3388668 RepID=UPI00396B3DFE
MLKNKKLISATLPLMLSLLAGCASNGDDKVSMYNGEVVFSENFTGGFEQWVGKEQTVEIKSKIVDDPLRENKKAAQSTVKVFGGDYISKQKFTAGEYVLSFDYLGTCSKDCGGVVGYGEGFPGVKHHWLAGTRSGFPTKLNDKNEWEHHQIEFNASYDFHLIFEQWTDSDGEPGTVLFADIKLQKK